MDGVEDVRGRGRFGQGRGRRRTSRFRYKLEEDDHYDDRDEDVNFRKVSDEDGQNRDRDGGLDVRGRQFSEISRMSEDEGGEDVDVLRRPELWPNR